MTRSRLSAAELGKRLETLDQQYTAEAYPPQFRPAEAFEAIYGSVSDNEQRVALFQDILDWFAQKHGKRIEWDGLLGESPLIIRGDLHFAQILFVERSCIRNVGDSIPTLAPETAQSLTPEESVDISQQLTIANMALNALYTLRCDKAWLRAQSLEFLKRAFFDLDGVVPALKRSDTQTSVFLCHQVCEKFLKAVYLQCGGTKAPKSFSHRCTDAFHELIAIDPRFAHLEPAVLSLDESAEGPQIKYETIPRTVEQAHSGWYSTLTICGNIADVLTCDHERGTADSSLRARRFYTHRTGLYYFCPTADAQTATLIAFETEPLRGTPPLMLQLDQRLSGTYLEVDDPAQSKRLAADLQSQLSKGSRWTNETSQLVTPPEWGSIPFMNFKRKA